ncbi:MAG: penicillin-binding protein 1A [Pseudomonadota bacterium]
MKPGRKEGKKARGGRSLILLLLMGGVAGMLAGCMAALVFWITSDLPPLQILDGTAPPSVTRVLSADGVVLDEWYTQRRSPTALDRIPPNLKLAVQATEDQHFYSHWGVDIKGLARAVAHNLLAMNYVEGASTITQQLAKNLFLSPDKTLTRKLREAMLALQLERRYTKDEILERYLNLIYYGSGAYGASMAARTFFGKSLGDLSLAECALIAGMPKSPSRYSPLVSPDRAKKRRDVVLSQMFGLDWISREEYEKAVAEPVKTAVGSGSGPKAGYFVEQVRQTLLPELGASALYQGGLTVRTSLWWDLQQMALEAVDQGLGQVRERVEARGGEPEQVQAALVCLDVATGQVQALVGGDDQSKTPFDRATQARRQPGSAFKPLVYALAIRGGLGQDSLVLDAPMVFPGGPDHSDWSPANYDGAWEGEICLRRALVDSRNVPAVRLALRVSPSEIVRLAREMGIRSTLAPNLSLALGSSEVTLEDLTGAYAVFPGQGRWVRPHSVLEVSDRTGGVVYRARPERRAVLDEKTAAVMVDMLKAVVREGTGRQARTLGVPLGGKTGTTNDCRDAWFVGFTPRMVVGVWVGRDDGASLGPKETGARAALPIWLRFMESVLKNRSHGDFSQPTGTEYRKINPVTGKPDPNGVLALEKKAA